MDTPLTTNVNYVMVVWICIMNIISIAAFDCINPNTAIPKSDFAIAAGAYNETVFILGGFSYKQQLTEYNIITEQFTYIDAIVLSETVSSLTQFWTQQEEKLYIKQYSAPYNIGIFNMESKQYTANWSPDAIEAGIYGACLSSTAQYLLITGGYITIYGRKTAQSTLQVLNINTKEWIINKPNFNEARMRHSCVVYQDVLYVFGGTDVKSIERISVPNIAQNSWSFTDSLSQIIIGSRAFGWMDSIYIIGGADSMSYNEFFDIIHILDPETGSVSVSTQTLSFGVAFFGVSLFHDVVYIFGGKTQLQTSSTNQWMLCNLFTAASTTATEASSTSSTASTSTEASATSSTASTSISSSSSSTIRSITRSTSSVSGSYTSDENASREEISTAVHSGSTLSYIIAGSVIILIIISAVFVFYIVKKRKSDPKDTMDLHDDIEAINTDKLSSQVSIPPPPPVKLDFHDIPPPPQDITVQLEYSNPGSYNAVGSYSKSMASSMNSNAQIFTDVVADFSLGANVNNSSPDPQIMDKEEGYHVTAAEPSDAAAYCGEANIEDDTRSEYSHYSEGIVAARPETTGGAFNASHIYHSHLKIYSNPHKHVSALQMAPHHMHMTVLPETNRGASHTNRYMSQMSVNDSVALPQTAGISYKGTEAGGWTQNAPHALPQNIQPSNCITARPESAGRTLKM